MKINKNNYEAFFLDYHEKNLNPAQVAELMLFLEQHPELKEELEDFENIPLHETERSPGFEAKDLLKKGFVNEKNFEEMALAYIEGLLPAESVKALLLFADKNPFFKNQLELYRKSLLLKDDKIIFENKSALKKEETGIPAEELSAMELSQSQFLFIAYVENVLSFFQQKQLDQLVAQNPLNKKELGLYLKTKLETDASVIFPSKNLLKRSVAVRRFSSLYYYVAAAASLALLIGLYLFYGSGTLNKGAEMAAGSTKAGSFHLMQQGNNNIHSTAWVNPVKIIRNRLVPAQSHILKNNADSSPNLVKGDHKTEKQSIPVKVIDTISKQIIVKNQDATEKAKTLINIFYEREDEDSSNQLTADYLSLREAVTLKVKNVLLKDEMNDPASYRENKKRFTWYDAMLVLTKGVRKLTGREVKVRKKYDENNELVAYEFTAGKYTYTKPVLKKL